MNLKPRRKLLSFALVLLSLPALAVAPGTAAPDFKGTDSTGTQHTLSQYRGKFVVLEWANQGCPYDRKHYLSGSMEALQKEWTAKGVVWLSIISSGVGQQGYVNPAEENEYLKKMHADPPPPSRPHQHHRPTLRGQNYSTHLRHRSYRQAHLPGRHRRQAHHQPGRPQGRPQLPQRNPDRSHVRPAHPGSQHPPLMVARSSTPPKNLP